MIRKNPKVICTVKIFLTFIRMIEQEVDSSSIGFIPTPERKSVMDFSYFVWTEPQAMVVPLPGEEPRLFAFIKPFQPIVIIFIIIDNRNVNFFLFVLTDVLYFISSKVWLLILIASFCVVFSMSLFSKVYSKLFIMKSVKDVSITNGTALKWASQYSVYVVNTLTNQGNIQDQFAYMLSQFIL
jgi:ionotropic glutamate receptor